MPASPCARLGAAFGLAAHTLRIAIDRTAAAVATCTAPHDRGKW